MQSAILTGIMLVMGQATITLELKLGLPAATSGSPKSLGVVDYTLKESKEAGMKLYLPHRAGVEPVDCVSIHFMLKYILRKLLSGGYKIMQSAILTGIMLVMGQATITLELNIH